VNQDFTQDLAIPTGLENQINLLRHLRFDRAAAYYRVKGSTDMLQLEMLRLMHESASRAYDEGRTLFDAGRLRPGLSRKKELQNYIGRRVRFDLRSKLDLKGIDYSEGQRVRVIGRKDRNFDSGHIHEPPDARADDIVLHVALARKTLASPQVRAFFNSEFRPGVVVIVRPSQLGPGSTYAITRPEQ